MDSALYDGMFAVEDRHWWFQGRRAVVDGLLRRAGSLAAGPRVLDAGSGTGRNLEQYRRLGDVTGVDASPLALEYCRRRGFDDVVLAGLEALPFEDDRFDLVFATDVLEHVEDDLAVLRELRRVSAPGAVLLVTVPVYPALWGPFDVAHGHCRRYTRRSMLDRLRAAGWRPFTASHFNALLLAPIAAVRVAERLLRRDGPVEYGLPPEPLNRCLAALLRAEAAAIRSGARLPAGLSLGVVCRR